MKRGPKHKLCRRLGSCVWGNPKCPSVKRPYPAGATARSRRPKLSAYGQLLHEKQKLRAHYNISERQLRFIYAKAKAGTGMTGEKLLRNLELRLVTALYRSGMAPSIFAANQAVVHRHVSVDGRVTDRPGYHLRPGQVITFNAQKSPALVQIAQHTDIVAPGYYQVDKDNAKITVMREPLTEEIPAGVDIMKVVEFYAR